ncbi:MULTISPECIES: hypothetical protein [Sutcliffiella]|nr:MULTISPECIES: hypothetical protein [Sutcliffiella]MED4018642.1 hypothetical protein [Sutcliffiella cohnii]WBL13055.1 hypothetical protein O1A01_14035 [Sutcliffiella sp. NC1]
MDIMSIIRYACSLLGILFLGFTYKNIFTNAKRKYFTKDNKDQKKEM